MDDTSRMKARVHLPEAAPASQRIWGETLVLRLIPPLLAFALVRGMLCWVAKATGYDPATANAWSHWDSAHYLSIAEHGYEFFSCARVPGYDPTQWCGNTAWFPGFPLAMKLVGLVTGLAHVSAGAWISATWCLASLMLIWIAFLRAELRVTHLLALCLAAFFPGHVYDHAVFPIAQFALLQLLTLWLYSERRFALAALAAAGASFTYTSGLFMCGVIVMHAMLLDREGPWIDRVKAVAIVCTGVVLGFVAVLALQRLQTGEWNAFFLTQAKYKYDPRPPTTAWWSLLNTLYADWPQHRGPNEQTIFVAILCSLSLGYAGWRRGLQRSDAVLVSFAVVYWLIPLILGGQLSLYRAEATLLPAVPLARRIPWYILLPLLLAALVISRLMATLFFKGAIT